LKSIAAFTKERAERSTFDRIRKKQSDADDIKKWEKELTRAIERFSVCFVSNLGHNLTHDVERSMLCYTLTLTPPMCRYALPIYKSRPPTCRLEMRLPKLDKQVIEKMVSTRGRYHYDTDASYATTELLKLLAPVKTAFHDRAGAPSPCLEGTRVQLLEDVARWMADTNDKTVFWLTGVAGTGKTTVAKSIADMASKKEYLVVTFFFSHTSADRRDHTKVIPTLAYQLARDARLRPHMVAAIDSDKDIATASTAVQVKRLLLDGLGSPSSLHEDHVLIVLDALDECQRDSNHVNGGDLIPILLSSLKDIPFAKVLLTSRPEPSIERMFKRKDIQGATFTLALHRDIEKGMVRADIARYLNHELSKLRDAIPNSPVFPTEADMRLLVERTDTLFIYARTVVEYVSDPVGRPDRRLAALIQARPEQSGQRYGRLDELYSYILQEAGGPSTLFDSVDDDLRSTLIALVLAQQPLTADALAVIAGVDQDVCRECLRRISALLDYQHDSDEPVRLMHLSFPDFLSDPRRCSALPGYVVDVASDHLRIVEHGLELMNGCLRYDICRIRDPSLLNSEVVDLEERLITYVSESLRYACLFWVMHWLEHIRTAGTQSRIPTGLEYFCERHLLHWIEVLSLTGNLYAVQRTMVDLISDMKVHLFFSMNELWLTC
jgi:phosphoglycolate phosphatase-like HAD superfamily hydrolase